MPTEPGTLVLVAASARALAESAVRGGYRVRVLDGFCDLDTRACGPCDCIPLALEAGLGLAPGPLLLALRRLTAAGPGLGLVYGAGLESAAGVLAGLPAGLGLLGNAPAVLARLADPAACCALLDGLGIDYPASRLTPPPAQDPGPWLLKCGGGSGGLGVMPWTGGDPRPARPHLFQRRLDGVPMSVLFIADGRDLRIIGYNRLLLADADPQRPFLYGGAIGQAEPPTPVRQTVAGWCQALVGTLGLCGLNNLDFILDEGRPWLVDINARPSATVALWEDRCPQGWVRRHVRACLGDLSGADPGAGTQVQGHRVVWAPRDLEVPIPFHWPDWSRDRSPPGTPIPAGTPLCSVLAQGPDGGRVAALLAARAGEILARVSGAGTDADGWPS